MNLKAAVIIKLFLKFRFAENILNAIEKTSKIDMYKDVEEKFEALTPDLRIHYQTVFK